MFILDIVVFLICLGTLVLIHELGHFLAARYFGVGVKRFSIGFGKRILSLGKDKYGTEYILSLIPLGGYVEMEGEDPSQCTGDDKEFFSKPIWQRVLIVGAGPIVNYIFGFLIFALVYLSGAPEVLPVVGDVLKDSVAEKIGIVKGDVIVEIDGIKVDLWDEMVKLIQKRAGKKTKLVVERGGKQLQFEVIPEEVEGIRGEKLGRLGIASDPSAYIIAKFPITKAVEKAWMRVNQISVGVVRGIYLLLKGDKQVRESIAGPIGIYDVTSKAMHLGFNVLLLVVASLSVSLAIFNLLPIPVLDGGHLLFLGMEAVYRKRLPEKVYMWMYNVGMAVVIGLMLFVLWNDARRLKEKISLGVSKGNEIGNIHLETDSDVNSMQ